jgi:NAD(P)-dependent dehydrogenase (short-subunit alcohol dehydrogenase family)
VSIWAYYVYMCMYVQGYSKLAGELDDAMVKETIPLRKLGYEWIYFDIIIYGMVFYVSVNIFLLRFLRLPLPRYKYDIAMAAVFLASEAGRWITGDTLVIDGGLHIFVYAYICVDVRKVCICPHT